tara:strand:- start:5191 stop:5793 length:603 start_codon:yes stop_codon:yes gene_type:complete
MKKRKIIELLIGSNNKGKIKEIRDLLPNKLKIYTPKNFNLKSPIENGKTFKENSYLKAKYFSKKTGLICISDDSGLEIDLLNKLPGIYSARWGGKQNNFSLAIKKVYNCLYKKDKKWKSKLINARFICSLTLYFPGGKYIVSAGKVEGKISITKKGKMGFGYDPIFIPAGKNKTFGEMLPKRKYKIDHRMKAFKKIKRFF